MTPSGLKDIPWLLSTDKPYRDAFIALSPSRPKGMDGDLPIPVADIGAYLKIVGEECVDERLRIMRLVQKQDRAFLDYKREQKSK